MAGSVAAAIQVGYGLTKAGAADACSARCCPQVHDVLLQRGRDHLRLREGAIVAPILKNYQVPADLPPSSSRR
jgi:raffinose/stachyose/melibiose transport system substrate-binding protein